MKNILKIRNALSRLDTGRFRISNTPPVFGSQLNSEVTTIDFDNFFWIGLGDDSNNEANGSVDVPSQEIEGVFKRLDNAVETKGVEALAWYVSFHNSADEWGIYIPMTSIHYLAKRLFFKGRIASNKKYQIVLDILLNHERFHFCADYAQTQLELFLGMPCRYLFQNQLKAGEYLEIEEALANAYMLRELKQIAKGNSFEKIKNFVLAQPAGYKDAIPYFNDFELYQHGLEEVVKSYVGLPALDRNPIFPISCFDWHSHFFDTESTSWNECPVHILHDDKRLGLPILTAKFLTCIPNIIETKKFSKMFVKLAGQYQEAWLEKKLDLASNPPNPKQFEALKGKKRGLYSIRVGKGHRAHLRPVNRYEYWEAVEIGTHTEMGHD
jgi:hypothetical protein